MKKYKTFGEVLAFIREHLEECEREDLRIAKVHVGGSDVEVYKTVRGTLNTVYPILVLNGLVIDVEQMESDVYDNCILIKVLV